MATETHMASSVHIPIGEYMATTYRPDREYVDGELLERNVGKYEHARIQALLAAWFFNHERDWNVVVVTEQRVQVSSNRVRIPDVALITPGRQPDVLVDPPLLVVEILSPDDSYAEMTRRCGDYLRMGVGTIWIVDPTNRTGHVCIDGSWTERNSLDVPGTPIALQLPELYRQLDPRN